jgi:glycosyltransferase involved in cell wall biosynthesis
MKISYAITVCNEIEEIKRLIPFLLKHKRDEDEIVVQMDLDPSSGNLGSEFTNLDRNKREVFGYIMQCQERGEIKTILRPLHKDFAQFKNHLTQQCSGDYIFQIDADEIPHKKLIEILPDLLDSNNEIDMVWVPRVNTVDGLTSEHIKKWKWNVNDRGWVNWPDWQGRIYRNQPSIQWKNRVHERLTGIETYSTLPVDEEFALYHPKTIERQEKQNEYYETI